MLGYWVGVLCCGSVFLFFLMRLGGFGMLVGFGWKCVADVGSLQELALTRRKTEK